MDEKTFRQDRKQRLWIERILACKASGLPVRTWCEQNGVAYSTYYHWLKVTRQDLLDMHGHMVTFEPSPRPDLSLQPSSPIVFHELPSLAEPAADSPGVIALTLPGLTLTVAPDITVKQVRAAIAVLRSLCC